MPEVVLKRERATSRIKSEKSTISRAVATQLLLHAEEVLAARYNAKPLIGRS